MKLNAQDLIWLRATARRTASPMLPPDDAFQEAVIGLLEAPEHDPARGMTRRSYVICRARWQIGEARQRLRINGPRRRRPRQIPYEMAALDRMPSHGETGPTAEEKMDIDAAMAALPEGDRAMVRAIYWNDETHEAVARRLAIKRQSLKYRLARVQAHIRRRIAGRRNRGDDDSRTAADGRVSWTEMIRGAASANRHLSRSGHRPHDPGTATGSAGMQPRDCVPLQTQPRPTGRPHSGRRSLRMAGGGRIR